MAIFALQQPPKDAASANSNQGSGPQGVYKLSRARPCFQLVVCHQSRKACRHHDGTSDCGKKKVYKCRISSKKRNMTYYFSGTNATRVADLPFEEKYAPFSSNSLASSGGIGAFTLATYQSVSHIFLLQPELTTSRTLAENLQA